MEIPSGWGGGRDQWHAWHGGTAYQASAISSVFLWATNVLSCLCQGCPLLPPFTYSSQTDSSDDSYGAGGGEQEEVLLMYSVTSSLHRMVEKPEPLGVRVGEGANDHNSGSLPNDSTAKRHTFFSKLPPETSNYTFRRSHKSDLVG